MLSYFPNLSTKSLLRWGGRTQLVIIIIIIKNECHIIVDRLQGCGQSKKLLESESESRSRNSKVSFDRRGASPVVI